MAGFNVPADGCSTTGCAGQIQEIYIDDVSDVYITPPEGAYDRLPCAMHGSQYFKLAPTHTKYKEIYGILAAAFIARTKVYLRVNSDSSGQCVIKYVVAYRSI